jgi:hypothetical protein
MKTPGIILPLDAVDARIISRIGDVCRIPHVSCRVLTSVRRAAGVA